MFMTLVDNRFLSLHDAYKYQVRSSPVNFGEENRKKIGQSDFCTYRTGSATLLRVTISSVETRKSRDFLWWKLRGISEEVTRVQRVAWKTSVEILATSVWSSV